MFNMETLKVLRVQEQAESCWKAFKERVLTKKTARENLLLNTEFGSILQTLLCDGNEQAKKVALNFVLKCLKAKIVSPTALITLIQQKMPAMNAPRIISMPLIENTVSVLLELERETGLQLIFQLASNDPRVIPFVIEKNISSMNIDASSDFINFLLGDPDLILSTSIVDDVNYKTSRCRLLSFLVANVDIVAYSELLITYLVWNSSHQCILELEFLTPLYGFHSAIAKKNYNDIHYELFDVFIEALCNSFFKFGSFENTIRIICESGNELVDEYTAYKIGCLLLTKSNYGSEFAVAVVNLLSRFNNLNSFAKVCCFRMMSSLNIDENLTRLMMLVFSVQIETNFILSDELVSKPFTEFGILVHLAYQGIRPGTSEHSKFFDLIEITKGLDNLESLNIEKYNRNGQFEVIFALLVSKWNLNQNPDEIVKGFLRLLGDANEDEESESIILRYSWVVDFFESNFTEELYLNYLPLICEFVTSTDNILFAFVKQKISLFMSQQKGNVSIQLPMISCLLALFESSQSRQSRLNFLTTMSLSFLHNLVTRNFEQIDTKAVYLTFKLAKQLCEVIVIDPRDIWTKYIEVILKDDLLIGNEYIRGSVYSFASALRIVPESKI